MSRKRTRFHIRETREKGKKGKNAKNNTNLRAASSGEGEMPCGIAKGIFNPKRIGSHTAGSESTNQIGSACDWNTGIAICIKKKRRKNLLGLKRGKKSEKRLGIESGRYGEEASMMALDYWNGHDVRENRRLRIWQWEKERETSGEPRILPC